MTIRKPVGIGGAIIAAAVAAISCVTVRAESQPTTEHDVKARYLFNFTKFVRWPDGATASPPFRICVIGDRRFAEAVDAVIAGESAYGQPLVRTEPESAEAARSCQILFIGNAMEGGRRMLVSVRDLPVLTVGESPTFFMDGGAIRFVAEKDRLRFDVNVPAAQRAGLEISSKLLRVARELVKVR